MDKVIKKIHYIDCLRGLAIIMVIAVHAAQFHFTDDSLSRFTKYGQLGVQLFFLASALTLSISAVKRHSEPHPVKKFYIRRYFRIAPLYYLGILLYFIINAVLFKIHRQNTFSDYSWQGILSNVLLIHFLTPKYNNVIVPGGWSIATEVLFYIIFPFLFEFINRLKTFNVIIINFVYAVAHLAILAILVSPEQRLGLGINSFYYYSLVNQFPVFLYGLIFYKLTIKNSLKIYQPVIMLIAGIILTIYCWHLDYAFALIPLTSGLAFLGLGLLAYMLEFKSKALEAIGKRSFSIYIIHFIFAWYFAAFIDKKLALYFNIYIRYLIYFSSTLCFSMIGAIFTERFIERYFIDQGRKLVQRVK